MLKRMLSFILLVILAGTVNAQLTPTDSTISGHITANRTLSGKTYLISGWVYVDSTYKITIKAGTKLVGEKSTKGALIIKRGAQIDAQGTSTNPIIFTSQQPVGLRASGDWGGVILCGEARNNLGLNTLIEGGVEAYHGGTNDADNSGILRYIRIEFAGIPFQPNNEINGLTCGSVGSGTTIDHIQVSYSGDDSYEWFGGAVNCDHLIAWKGQDDDFDTDNGFSGTVQYGFGYRDPWIADQSNSEAFESDNDATGTTNTPRTAVTFRYFTCIGPKEHSTDDASTYHPKFYYAIHQRRSSMQNIYNTIITGFPMGGVYVQDQPSTDALVAGTAKYNNVIFAGMSTSVFGNGTWTPTYASGSAWFNAQTGNSSVAEPSNLNLVDPYNVVLPNCRPQSASTNGAFSSSTDNWDAGWTNYDPQGVSYINGIDWICPIIAKNSIRETRRIYMGAASTATTGTDASLGEATLPGLPPEGIDLRWNNAQALNILPNTTDVASRTYTLQYTIGLTTGTSTLAWDNTKLPATGRFILSDGVGGALFPNVDMRAQNSVTFSEVAGSYTFTITHYLKFDRILVVKSGWNLMSFPGTRVAGMSPISSIFTQKDATASVYAYSGSYSPITSLTPGQAFWLRCTTMANVTFSGLLYAPRTSVSVSSGWNLVGVYEYNATTSGLSLSTGTVDGLVYGYDPTSGYTVAGTMNYGYGYWVHVSATGSLTLPNTNIFAAKEAKNYETDFIKASWGKINIRDNKGAHYTLYVDNNATDLEYYKMPPLPLAGLFDIRYATDRLVENLSSSKEIALQGVEFPITVSVENTSLKLNCAGKMYSINSDAPVVLDAQTDKISVMSESAAVLPNQFSLEQNYPNPFNPSTTINFSLPSDSHVRITIYNSLGEMVSELVNSNYPAGKHNISWNASNLTSGVYYYKLEAGSFVNTKKMMLVK